MKIDKAFEQLHLYLNDYDFKMKETELSEEEAKAFYLKKIDILKEQNYKLKDF